MKSIGNKRGSTIEKPQAVLPKIPEYLVKLTQKEDLRTAYSLFEAPELPGITFPDARSIMWNFGYWKLTQSEFETELRENNIALNKERMTWEEILKLVTKKYYSGGKDETIKDIFGIFDRKGKGKVNVNEMQRMLEENLEFSIGRHEVLDMLEDLNIKEGDEVELSDFAYLYSVFRMRYI